MGPLLAPPAALRRFALPAVACSLLLLAGYVRLAEGTRHPSPWGYRNWSFGALAYSDVIALHEDRGATRHRLPYIEDKIEYPVLMGIGMWWPSLIAPDRAGYFAVTYFVLALCALGTLWVLASLPQARPWAFAASPALLVYAGLNWDLLAIFPLFAGVWLWANGRLRGATAVISAAVWTKLFPLLVLGVLWLKRPLREIWKHLLVFAAVTLAVNLPFAIAGRQNWSWFFDYTAIRELEPSLYLLLGADAQRFVPTANAIGAASTLAAAAALAAIEWKTRRLDPLRGACALVCVFFIFTKIYSPQYWIWAVALVALAGLPGWLTATVSAAAFADYVASFARLHLQVERVWGQAIWFDGAVFWPMVAIRYLVLLACAVWAFAHTVQREAAL